MKNNVHNNDFWTSNCQLDGNGFLFSFANIFVRVAPLLESCAESIQSIIVAATVAAALLSDFKSWADQQERSRIVELQFAKGFR